MNRYAIAWAAACWLAGAGVSQAAVQWAGNGHWYQAVPHSMTWAEAEAAASAILPGGHLATVTSQAENDFVTALLPTDFTPGAWAQGWWIGGVQSPSHPGFSEPAGGWEWITAEALVFSNWYAGQPNDSYGLADENRMSLMSGSFSPYERGYWNDLWATHQPEGYIVESASAPYPAPLPGTALLFVPALAALLGLSRRRA
jgi:hypothetical protein